MNSGGLKNNLLIAIGALLVFIPFLGSVHLFDWDEINFAECAREMLVTHDYFSVKINFQPFWEKPPAFIWMQALSMSVFGINEFAARLPNAICGIFTLLILYNIGKKLVDQRFGLVWVLAYTGSMLPHFYFKSGIIDPWFNLFIFCGIYYFVLFTNDKSNRLLIFSALLIGLGVITKGPVAVLIFGLCVGVYWMLKRFQPIITKKQIVIYTIAFASVGGLWFLMLVVTGNAAIIKDFFLYQVRLFNTEDAGHGGPFYYHWLVLLIGCFPVSIFALQSFKKNNSDTPFQKHFKFWMMILFFVVLILFSIVKTKIIHYSSLCYFPLSYLGAYAIYKIMNADLQWKKNTSTLLMFVSGIIGLLIFSLPFINKYKQEIIASNFITDSFAIENLKANVQWNGFEGLIGVILIVGTIIMLLLIRRNKLIIGITGLFIISTFTVSMTAIFIAPKIEQYSQGAAIEFYQYLEYKDCYVETIGYKSYANLFYSNKKEPLNKNSFDMDWLLRGPIDKTTYFVCKNIDSDEIEKRYEELKEIYRKNGFVFLQRMPKK